jgi:hypothetical protein
MNKETNITISSLLSSLHKHKEDEIFALLQTYNNIPHKTIKLRTQFTSLLAKIIWDNEEQLQNIADQMMPTGIKKIKSLQWFENMKYLIKTHLNIQDDEDTALTRTKIAWWSYEYYDSTDLIHSTYYPGICDLKILKQRWRDHRFWKIDEYIKYVFKDDMIFPDNFQFPSAEDLYTAKLRSMVINTLNLPLKQSMTTKDIDTCRTMIAGGNREEYDEHGVLTSCTFFDSLIWKKLLKDFWFNTTVQNNPPIYFTFAFPELFPDTIKFPITDELYISKLRSLVIKNLQLPLKQFMSQEDIDICISMILGGNVEKYNEQGVLLSCTYFENIVTRKTLKDFWFNKKIQGYPTRYFTSAFPELFPQTFEFPSAEDLHVKKLRSLMINQIKLPLKKTMTLEEIQNCGAMITGGTLDQYDELGVLSSCTYYENFVTGQSLKDLWFGQTSQKNPTRFFASAFPELFTNDFMLPNAYSLHCDLLRHHILKDKNLLWIYKKYPSQLERQYIWNVISNEITSRKDYFRKHFNWWVIYLKPVLEVLQNTFPELQLKKVDIFDFPSFIYSDMKQIDVINLYQEKIMQYIKNYIKCSDFQVDQGDNWYQCIKFLLPPYIQRAKLVYLNLYVNNTYMKQNLWIEHYSDLIIKAFPNYPLKRIMYGKTGGWIKSKKANFRVEAMQAIPVSDTQQIEIYTMRDDDTAKAQELLQQYIHQQKKYEIRRDKKSIVFEKMCEMLTELEEMRYHYDLDTLIKWAISRSIQTEKRNNVKALWNNVTSNYYRGNEIGDDAAISAAVYKKTDWSHDDNEQQLNDSIDGITSITSRWQAFGDYLDTLDDTDRLKRAFIKTVVWFKKQPKNAKANQQDMILQLVNNAHMTLQEIIARFEEEYDGDDEDYDY